MEQENCHHYNFYLWKLVKNETASHWIQTTDTIIQKNLRHFTKENRSRSLHYRSNMVWSTSNSGSSSVLLLTEAHLLSTLEICQRLSESIDEIRQSNKLFLTNGNTRGIRSAPLAIVGWVQNEVFGVMDRDNADHIEPSRRKWKTSSGADKKSDNDSRCYSWNNAKNSNRADSKLWENRIDDSKAFNETDTSRQTEEMLGLAQASVHPRSTSRTLGKNKQ